jgi:hypothetical protein
MRFVRAAPGRMSDGHRLICIASGMLLIIARVYPFDRFPLVHCPLKSIAHIPCPACGMTRAFVHWTHFDWGAAIQVSPLGFMLATFAGLAVAYGVLRHTVLRRGWSLELTATEGVVWRVAAVACAVSNWIYLIASGAAA